VALLGLAGVALIASWAFLHRHGIADADAMVMAAGLAHGLQPGVPFRESLLYGRLISPGFYSFFHVVLPRLVHDRAQIVDALNGIAAGAAGVTAAALYLLYRASFGRPAAIACTLIVALSPVAWESGTSFHPIGIALPLMVMAGLAFAWSERSRRGRAWWAIATLLAAAALLMRNEVALAFPAALVAAALSPGRWRTWLRALVAEGVALGIYLIAAQRVASATAGEGGLAGWATGFASSYLRPAAIGRSAVWASFALGPVTVALAAAGLRRAAREPEAKVRRGLAVALALALPAILLWLPNTTAVLRHYLLALPALVWIAGAAWLERMPRAGLVAVTLAVLIGNLLIPEALYAGYARLRPGSHLWPNGTFLSSHRLTADAIDRARRLELAARPEALGEGAGAANRGLFAQVDWRGYGHVLYGLALADTPWTLRSTSRPFEGSVLYQYRIGTREVRLLLAQLDWAAPGSPQREGLRRVLAGEAAHARQAGLAVIVPHEVTDQGLLAPAQAHPPY